MKKLPPIEKVYEAYSAIADNRVTMLTEQAAVLSSNRAKEHTVAWSGNAYSSNDNATHWQGYAGYPVIAVLMLQGLLPLDKGIAALFADINWTETNAAVKRDYAKAVETVFTQLQCDEEKQNTARLAAAQVYDAIKTLNIEIKRSAPRKSKK